MNSPKHSMLALATALAASTLLSACYVVPARPYRGGGGGYAYDDGYAYGPPVTVAPPLAQV